MDLRPGIGLDSVLVANRGEIARRVLRTARELGVRGIAVYSEADAELPFVTEADEAVLIGSGPPADSYLNVQAVLAAARATGASAVHPGYGFLSENADFARAVRDAGMTWVGPEPESIVAMGDKIAARNAMSAAGVPVVPGTDAPVRDEAVALAEAERIGYPVMVKAAAGGGGIGMAAAHTPDELRAAFDTAASRAERFFADPAIFLEKYVPRARHVEVQILGLADGSTVAVGQRDCSVQRRHQKVVEEALPPHLDDALRARLDAIAVEAGNAIGYRNAGTVELLLDADSGEAYFLEMNTRLQVEHPVTEMTTGLDLVAEQFRIAAGEPVSFDPLVPIRARGHAIEFRVYAEDPVRFLPGPGRITEWVEPEGEGVRVDAGYRAGNTVTPFYDPLMAKLVVHGDDRAEAIERARAAVSQFRIAGPKNNLPFFERLLAHDEFLAGGYDTGLVARV